MSQADQGVYIIRDDGEGEWATPKPAHEVIVEEVLAATDLSRDAVEPLSDHVDFEALRAILSGEREGPLTVTVEGYEVTIDRDGTVTVDG